mgnify:CR=1
MHFSIMPCDMGLPSVIIGADPPVEVEGLPDGFGLVLSSIIGHLCGIDVVSAVGVAGTVGAAAASAG